MQLQQPHAVYLEARPPDAKGRSAVTIRDLLRATLRMRPDRIVVGECRGGEALDLIQAMTSGHGGSLSTVHATYPHDTLHRLETLCLMSDVELPLSAMRAQIASAVNVIVQTSRMNDGSRKITHVAECLGLDEGGHYKLEMLFEWKQSGVEAKTGRVLGTLHPTGKLPTFVEEIKGAGLALPEEMLRVIGDDERTKMSSLPTPTPDDQATAAHPTSASSPSCAPPSARREEDAAAVRAARSDRRRPRHRLRLAARRSVAVAQALPVQMERQGAHR